MHRRVKLKADNPSALMLNLMKDLLQIVREPQMTGRGHTQIQMGRLHIHIRKKHAETQLGLKEKAEVVL